MKKLYSLDFDYGRMGSLDGLFIAEESIVNEIIESKREVYFGEVLGKHSDVYGSLDEDEITVKSDDQAFITKLEELLGSTLSGFNPVEIYLEQKAEGQYDD